jgi:hypothetical protein
MKLVLPGALFVSLCLSAVAVTTPPRIDWPRFFSKIGATGVVYSDELKKLDGKQVILRGYAASLPAFDGGVFLNRFQHDDPHDVAESDLPFDAVAVVWDSTIEVGRVPIRPTIVGTLRLGNRTFGDNAVTITIESARPWIEPEKTDLN